MCHVSVTWLNGRVNPPPPNIIFYRAPTLNIYFLIAEISSFSETTYANGEEVVLSCVIDFGATGTGPTSVTWTGLESLTETDQVGSN